jgi:hypothetical protein
VEHQAVLQDSLSRLWAAYPDDLGFGGDREHVWRRLRITDVAFRFRRALLQTEVTMSQPYSSSGQPAEPRSPAVPEPRSPAVPEPVRTAVTFMYAGAAVSTVTLIIALALIPGIKAALRAARPGLTAAQASDVNRLITLAMVFGLAVIAAWLWMAQANGQGKNWARIVCTVLFGLATLELIRVRPQYRGGHVARFVIAGHVYPVIHSALGATVLGLIVPVLLWLIGLAAVWLLWRPACSAFFHGRVSPARAAAS